MRFLIFAAIIAIALPSLAVGQTSEMAAVEGKHIILKVAAEDLKHLDDPEAWVAKLDKAYEAYVDLVGTAPYGGKKITILSVEENPGGWAVAGNPIKWHRKHIVPTFEDNINKGDWCFGILHEISHDFDLDFDARWAWELEFWANHKMDYVHEAVGTTIFFDNQVCDHSNPKSLKVTDIYLVHENNRGYNGRMLQGGWFNDAIHNKFTSIVREVGWDTYKRVFRWYNTLNRDEIPRDANCKRSLFIRALEEQSGYDVSSQFIDWGFSHLTVDPTAAKDARETAHVFIEKDWIADIINRPIHAAPGETVKIRVDVSEKNPVRYEKGLGTHPMSEIIYDLGGKYEKFESIIGIPGRSPSEGRYGSVSFEVVTDGSKVYTSPILRGGGLPLSVSLDVTGVKELKLLVNDGGNGGWGDGCAWVDAKVMDANNSVTYLSDMKPVSAKQGYLTLKLDRDIEDDPLEFFYTPCKKPVKVVGKIVDKKIEFIKGTDPEAYEYTIENGFSTKGKHYVWLTINVGDSPITQHELVTIIVK